MASVLSEGAAVVCLEERESAIARGANILGEILGYGNFSDAYDFTAPAEDKIARVQTIRHALEQAGISAAIWTISICTVPLLRLTTLNETEAIKWRWARRHMPYRARAPNPTAGI